VAGAFDAKVDISTAEASAALVALRGEVKNLGKNLVELDGILKATNGNLKETADKFTQMIASQRAAATVSKEVAQAKILEAREQGITNVATAKAAEIDAKALVQKEKLSTATAQTGLATARTTESTTRATIATERQSAATAKATESQLAMHDSLSNSRYLMYDVGATYGVLAAGLMAIPAATAAVAASYQKDFAQVQRVTDGLDQTGLKTLKEDLKSLATDIPIGFDEISRIAQLGSQMGVANDQLVTFTETTAKFVAVTGISADTGATLFGRMESSFTADVQKYPDFFERLGSSIAYVGAKTVATDPEISSMLSQIGPLGAAAGMSASNVTGLAAALASVRVQPELARGTLTRVFGQLNRDTAEGSPKMAEFGKLMGITGDAATKLWQTDSSTFFTNLIKGLNGAQLKNGELTTTFDKLGITASRDVSALTKLAVGYDTLQLSMDAANKGFTDGTALSTMSKVTFETVSAKLTEMANSWKNFADTIATSGPGLQVVSVFVDTLKNAAIWMDNLVKHVPAVGLLINVLMGISVVTALFLGFKAAQAFVMAGMIGFQQASSRGMANGLSLSNMMKTLAQTMLQAKGATDAQSRALLDQVGATRALIIATSTSKEAIAAGVTTPMAAATAGTGKFVGGLKGAGSALLGLAGGPIGIALGALTLLIGGFINAQAQAETAGKAIATAMKQGADAGTRAIAEQLNNRKVELSPTEGDISFSKLGQSVTEVARQVDVSFGDIVKAVAGGTESADKFQKKMQELQKQAGTDKFKSDAYGWLGRVAKEQADAAKTAAAGLSEVEKAAPAAGTALTDMGDGADAGTTSLQKMTKALKDLNDEVFGVIDAQSALQTALSKIGEGLQKSQSFSVNSEGGRANIANVQDALTKARDYYKQLMDSQQLTAQQAAQGYTDFTAKLMGDIKNKFGGDTSYIQSLADQTTSKFQAAIGGAPVSVPITVDPAQVQTMAVKANATVKDFILAQGIPTIPVNVATDEAQTKTLQLAHWLAEITGYPYKVVLDALTNPAAEKSKEIYALITSITDKTYVAPIDADTSAAVANVQNFASYARTELANIQYAMKGLGEGGVGLDTFGIAAAKKKYSGLMVPTATAAPTQVHSQAQPSASIPTNLAPSLGGIADGYDKAAEAAKKAGKSAKEAAKDIASGIDDAVRSAEDYGNRLKTALMSAYNQQYALTTATDEYHSALNAITKKREDEIKQVDDLRTKIKQLNDERDKELITANKAKIEQGISLKYGEGARAVDYGNQAQTALDNAAAKQKEINASSKEAQTIQDGIGALTGYSDAAIANRAALRGLETKMIDMVAAYATLGHSSEEVRAYAQNLTGQYQKDVGQIGFNITAVAALQGSFQRYIDTINRVPQFVPTTVTADTGAATQEVAAFGDALAANTQDQTVNIDVNTDSFEWHLADALARVQANLQKTLADPIGSGSSIGGRKDGSLAGGMYTGGMVRGFASGGMVPGTPPSNPRADNMMAQVDGKGLIKIRSREFIQPQEAVDYYGPDFMEAIRTMSLPKFNMGGSVSGRGGGSGSASQAVVELGAATLAAMAEMRQDIKLFTENRTIAESANAGNRQLAAEGHRS